MSDGHFEQKQKQPHTPPADDKGRNSNTNIEIHIFDTMMITKTNETKLIPRYEEMRSKASAAKLLGRTTIVGLLWAIS